MHLCAISSSKILKNESKLDQNSNTGLSPKRAYQHSWSADWPKFSAQPEDFLIQIKPIFFYFLEIMTRSNLYLVSFSIPTSINRGNKSELEALLF